jgi:hypothetical protein
MTQDTLHAIDANIRDAKPFLVLADALDRLQAQRDFKTVVAEGYFHAEAIRLVHLKADPAMQTPERQAAIVAQIDAIGALSAYFRTIAHNAALARKAIAADEAMREELLAEQLEAQHD